MRKAFEVAIKSSPEFVIGLRIAGAPIFSGG